LKKTQILTITVTLTVNLTVIKRSRMATVPSLCTMHTNVGKMEINVDFRSGVFKGTLGDAPLRFSGV